MTRTKDYDAAYFRQGRGSAQTEKPKPVPQPSTGGPLYGG